MRFLSWWLINDFFFENADIRTRMSGGNPQEVYERIQRRCLASKADPSKPVNIINAIRHEFTNYDDSWRRLEKNRPNYDIDEYIEAWNMVVEKTASRVDGVLELLRPNFQNNPVFLGKLFAANMEWKDSKLKQVPQAQPAGNRAWGRSLV